MDKQVWPPIQSESTTKKLLSVAMLTVCALALSEREAQAWSNTKFSIGLNFQRQSGNNNVLWGAWKNGQVPGPDGYGIPPPPYGPELPPHDFAPGMMSPGLSQPPATQGFPFFGGNPTGAPQAYAPQAAPPAYAAQQQPQGYYPTAQSQQYNPYQATGYQPPPAAAYPNYNNPGYNSQVPSYWYQGR